MLNIELIDEKPLRNRPLKLLVVLLTLSATASAYGQAEYSFESTADYLAAASAWPAWRSTLQRHHDQREAIQQCLLDADGCTSRLKGLRHILLKGADLEPEQQVRLVNRYINKQRYKDDRVMFKSGYGNQWRTLTEFLQLGGDCEDFAVAKYFALREFGFDAEDMRIVVGREPHRRAHHAMLAVRFDDSVLLLENDNTIRRNGNQDINRFVYAVNEQGIWDHERVD